MKDSSVAEEVLHVGVFVIVVAVVVIAGWNEPLRYLLMKPDQIAAEEAALFPPAPDRDPISSWRPGGTALDRAPYFIDPETKDLIYSDNIDPRKMGSQTETDRRTNLRRR